MSFTAGQIRLVLASPEGRDWTIQGLGMLRLYLDEEHVERLHLWDPDRAEDEVSTIHDHPWDFESRILSGSMQNIRFHEANDPRYSIPVAGAELFCGTGGHLLEETRRTTRLIGIPDSGLYLPGSSYQQDAPELHESWPMPGTVTVIRRTFKENRDIAHVYWAEDQKFVSAEPRPATEQEVMHFVGMARRNWRE